MNDLKEVARAAKLRLKSNYWQMRKRDLDVDADLAREKGIGELKIKSTLSGKLKREIEGGKQDEFYLKVKALLDSEGEVSDAIGRLTDREEYSKLTYEEQQRYTLKLSGMYRQALEKYRKEKEAELP